MALAYPRELPHPNGFRSVTVYSPEEDRQAHAEFAEFRIGHLQAAQAAVAGKPAPALIDARVRAAADLQTEQEEEAARKAEFDQAVDAEVKRRLAAKGNK